MSEQHPRTDSGMLTVFVRGHAEVSVAMRKMLNIHIALQLRQSVEQVIGFGFCLADLLTKETPNET
jgi:hypothetical protein